MIDFEEDRTEEAAARTVDALREKLLLRHLTIGTAESCTGGGIAALLTSVAGSSDYVAGGIVSYTNDIKHRVLHVSQEDLDRYSAVSQPVVEQMARGAATLLQTDCAVATSGIAGPGGGSEETPVGTVWIAACYHRHLLSHCFHFGSDRHDNTARAIHAALKMLLGLILSEE